ncbi:MAG: pirin family protein, partial [Pseudomonadota bacterium]
LTPGIKDLGDGFRVRRALPSGKRRMVGPFIFFDQMGPSVFSGEQGIDVRPHPHIGLATITFLFKGGVMHRDSLGTEMVIRPGDVNWMKAGRGIVHSERTPAEMRSKDSHELSGIQAWVALPKSEEQAEPAFVHYPQASLPRFEHGGAHIALIAGQLFGHQSPVAVDWPTIYAEIRVPQAVELHVSSDYHERALYVVSGEIQLDQRSFSAGSMVILTPGKPIDVQFSDASHAMLLGGKTMDGERLIWWNFVASNQALMDQAKADWQADRFDPVPNEDERIPLPEA